MTKSRDATRIGFISTRDSGFVANARASTETPLVSGRPSLRDAYDNFTARCEMFLRGIIATLPCTPSDHRALRYEPKKLGLRSIQYREIDALIVGVDHNDPLVILEFKISTIPKRGDARRQLDDVLAIATQRWPHLSSVGIWVDTSSLAIFDGKSFEPSLRMVTPIADILAAIASIGPGQHFEFGVSIHDVLDLARHHDLPGARDVDLEHVASSLIGKRTRRPDISYTEDHPGLFNPFATLLGDVEPG